MTYLDSQKYLQRIDYSIEIYPFADPARIKTIIVSNFIPSSVPSSLTLGQSTGPSTYYVLESFNFVNDVFNPIQTGSAKVAQSQYNKLTFFQDVAEGDLLFIKENGNTIFTGYIESLQLDITSEGSIITINFANILKQLSICKVFGEIFNTIQPAQGVTFGNFLANIAKNTLLYYATQISMFNINIQKGDNESASVVLKASNTVFVSISSYMTILQTLNKVLYPYQRVIYQDSLGDVNIAPLSLFNDLVWYFSQSNTRGLGFPFTNISVRKNAAGVNNFEYATLFNIPIAQGVLGGNQSQVNSSFFCQYSPPATYYTRLNQLYNSGIFTVADIIIEDLISDPNKIDQTLNNISEVIQSGSGSSSLSSQAAVTIASINQTPSSQIPIPSQGPSDVSNILYNYAARAMAENLIEETQIFVTTPRVTHTQAYSTELLPLPINRLVNVSLDQGVVETSAFFCRGYVLNYSNSGTMVTLNLCKPLAGGAYWVNGELINA